MRRHLQRAEDKGCHRFVAEFLDRHVPALENAAQPGYTFVDDVVRVLDEAIRDESRQCAVGARDLGGSGAPARYSQRGPARTSRMKAAPSGCVITGAGWPARAVEQVRDRIVDGQPRNGRKSPPSPTSPRSSLLHPHLESALHNRLHRHVGRRHHHHKATVCGRPAASTCPSFAHRMDCRSASSVQAVRQKWSWWGVRAVLAPPPGRLRTTTCRGPKPTRRWLGRRLRRH